MKHIIYYIVLFLFVVISILYTSKKFYCNGYSDGVLTVKAIIEEGLGIEEAIKKYHKYPDSFPDK